MLVALQMRNDVERGGNSRIVEVCAIDQAAADCLRLLGCGFLDATYERLSRVPAGDQPLVVLPSYNGARKLPVLAGMVLVLRRGLEAPLDKDARLDQLVAGDGAVAQVRYLFHFPTPVYSHDLDTSQIEALRPGDSHENARVRGLTLADFKMDTLYRFNIRKKWFRDYSLVWVEDLRVEFSYNTLNVYVASDFPEDGCEYRETLGHENQHVEIHRRIYEKYKGILQDEVAGSKSIPLESAPLTVVSQMEGREKISQALSTVVDPVFRRFSEELSQEEARIDTRESYMELRNRCSGW